MKNKQLNEIQVKLHSQIKSLNNTIANLESTNDDMLSKYQVLTNENVALKKVFLYFYHHKSSCACTHKNIKNNFLCMEDSLVH